MAAPTWWTALPEGWPDAPKVDALRAEFGASGPLGFVCLLAESARQYYGTTKAERKPGRIVVGWRRLANWAACDVETARRIVDTMAELGEIDIERTDDFSFALSFRDWLRWHPAALHPEAAERQRRYRERQHEQAPEATDSDAEVDW